MARWLLQGLMLVLAAGVVGVTGGCASTGAPDDSDRIKREEQRRDSPFYTPFSA
jgi:hypothetical protein